MTVHISDVPWSMVVCKAYLSQSTALGKQTISSTSKEVECHDTQICKPGCGNLGHHYKACCLLELASLAGDDDIARGLCPILTVKIVSAVENV